MKSEIINVGTEIILGNIVNTHSRYLSEELAKIGIDVYYHVSVGDNKRRLEEIIKTALDRSDLIILTGGLGPTEDDITKDCVASVLNKELIFSEKIMKDIDDFYYARNIKFVKSVERQAYIIEGCEALKNEVGTAPGIYVKENDKIVILLPGPPRELENVFENCVIPKLKKKTNEIIESKTLSVFGIGESNVEDAIIDLINKQTNPTIATYAKDGHVEVRVTAKSNKLEVAGSLIENTVKHVEAKIGEYIFSKELESLEEVVFKILMDKGLKIGFCESCTGGLISSRFTRIPGSSAVFDRGIVTYSNQAKMDEVSVSPEDLDKYGAVSKQVAIGMARGLYNKCDIDIAVSVTGIAGPTGGSKEKPVGLVYFGVVFKDKEYTVKRVFLGDRHKVQNKTANTVFDLVRKLLLGKEI
ncbi:competence/damage-inducible protein A [Abyssisolibacter fermentans]|uniref:competence/damage-inducible protein A n=1 Tax=Abyssisolibacter fermentans TaxID=1766203 RepID=UPI0008356C6C|nr:competence/damage-inducible protein A [Abyssisolibacter fermentans]